MMKTRALICLSACFLLSVATLTTGGSVVESSRPLSAPLTNIVSFKGNIYVGGANMIYVLDKDLNIIQTASTCFFSTPTCNIHKNVNKVLLVNERRHGKGLITCGSGNNGTCELRNISNVELVISKSSSVQNTIKYLKISTDIRRPVQGVITEFGELTLAVTFGEGMEQIIRVNDKHTTYRYAISTWNLPGFSLSEEKTLRLKIQQPSINEYLIYYKASFHVDWMTYFVTNQKRVVGANDYVSKLARICQVDTQYNSYTDIIIECRYDGVNYNLIQDAVLLNPINSTINITSSMLFVGAFTRGNDPENAAGDTVICVTELKLLDNAIMVARRDNAISCENSTSAERYLLSHKEGCISETDYNNYLEWCEYTSSYYKKVIGKIPLAMESSFKVAHNDGIVSTLHGTVYNNNHLVLILGTNTGKFIQTNVFDSLSIEEYGRNTVEGFYPIIKIYSEDDDTLFVLSSYTVSKYTNTNCSEYQRCADVMSTRNPLCGWCVYKQRATRKSACSTATNHWLSSLQSCVTMFVEPPGISVAMSSNTSNVNITLRVKHIPVKLHGDTYSCRFKLGSNLVYESTTIPEVKNNFVCKVPEVSAHTNAIIELLVKTQTGRTTLLSSVPLLLFDCGLYKRCAECVRLRDVNCHWCSNSATCQETNTCPVQSISNSTFCPKLLNDRDRHFVPDRLKTLVLFRATHLIYDQGMVYKCVVLGRNITVEAEATASSVSCPLNIMKNENKKKEDYRIVINYGQKGGQLAEVNDAFLNFVTVYRCTDLATNCSHCQALNKTRYSCDWCKNSQCSHKNNTCRSTQCPAPSITKVVPRNGPVKGGTRITIYGTNLGISVSNVDGITVAGVPCALSTDDYHISENQDFETKPQSRLICITHEVPEETIGIVNVVVDSKSSKLSAEFAYKRPNVAAVYPQFIPKAGGTRITLFGNNLGIGNRHVSVFIGSELCLQPEVYPNLPLDAEGDIVNFTIQCTAPSTFGNVFDDVTDLYVLMDKGIFMSRRMFFSFVTDPIITVITPKKGFVRGGTIITVEGNCLDNANSAILTIKYAGKLKRTECEIMSSERTTCKVPRAPRVLEKDILRQLTDRKAGTCVGCIEVMAVIGFDGVTNNFTITYFRDPIIHSLSGDGNTVTLDRNNLRLYVNGEHLNLVATSFDITITIGVETCAVINLTSISIVCVAATAPPRTRIPGLENSEVNVTIGYIHKTVGYVRYLQDNITVTSVNSVNSVVIVISTVVSVFLSVIVVIGTILICRQYRRMKEKIWHLERSKDETEMTNVPREYSTVSNRYTTAGSEGSGIYSAISEDDMNTSVKVGTDENSHYDKPSEYLEFSFYVKNNEKTLLDDREAGHTHIIQKEITKAGSDYIHPCKDDNDDDHLLHHIFQKNETNVPDIVDSSVTPCVERENAKQSQVTDHNHPCSKDSDDGYLIPIEHGTQI